MNALTKPPLSKELPPGDPLVDTYQYARNEWDNRIGDAATSAKNWRLHSLLTTGLLALSICFNYQQATSSKIVPYVIERDALGNPVARRVDDTAMPSDRAIQSALMRWVRNSRTVFVDTEGLKHDILVAYQLTETGSPAKLKLDRFYQERDPFTRAKMETVNLDKLDAMPIGTGPDANGVRTFRVEWQETSTPRDGIGVGVTQKWVASISFRHVPPTTAEQIENNPDGIFVVDFTWSGS